MSIRSRVPLLLLTLLLPLGSCASDSGARKAPMVGLDAFTLVPHDYEASVSNVVWNPAAENFQASEEDEPATRFVHLWARTVILTNEEVEDLVGARHSGSWTGRTSRSSAEAAFHRLEGGDERLVSVRPGQEGVSTVLHQSAFIERFKIVSRPDQIMVDPVVEVACEGLMVRMKGTPDESSNKLQVEASIEHHHLARPIPVLEVQLPQALMPVSIQQPVTTHQVLRFAESLGPDEAIVGGIPLTGKPLRMHVFIVTADVRDLTGKRTTTTE